MNKKCFTILAAFLFLGSISIVKAENKNILPLPALQRSTDTGYIAANADNTIDLGRSDKEFKDLYIDGVAYIDSLDSVIYAVADITVTTPTVVGILRFDTNTTDLYISTSTGDTNSWQKVGAQN